MHAHTLASITLSFISLTLSVFGKLQLTGYNAAGLEFGCDTEGSCTGTPVSPPADQAKHFASLGFNIVRLPLGWSYLQPELSGSLSTKYLSQVDKAVKSFLSASSSTKVILELHCYGRRDGEVIGSGSGASDKDFADLWSRLASLYKSNPSIIFGLINEPHDQPIDALIKTQQAAVRAIRNAGASSQPILLSAGEWSHMSGLKSHSEKLFAISDVGRSSKSLLYVDLHTYLDADGSGKSRTCTNSQASNFAATASLLASAGRQALVTEIGGSNSDSCIKFLGQALGAISKASSQFLGFTGWAAGAFDGDYELTMTPNSDGSDQAITKVYAKAADA